MNWESPPNSHNRNLKHRREAIASSRRLRPRPRRRRPAITTTSSRSIRWTPWTRQIPTANPTSPTTERETTALCSPATRRSHCELIFSKFFSPRVLTDASPFRPGGGIGNLSSDTAASSTNQPGGPPNRPLPPTPDDDAQGDRTLIMKRVSAGTAFHVTSHTVFVECSVRKKVRRTFSLIS